MRQLPPGSWIGILGGGQLGRMTAMAAAQLGYHIHVFCSAPEEPAVEVSACQTFASFDDEKALTAFAKSVDVVTLEWENVPLSALDIIQKITPVCPGRHILEIAQDRGLEKEFAKSIDVGTADFALVSSAQELEAALKNFSLPCVLKSTRMGYDGHGQVTITPGMTAQQAWKEMGSDKAILEAFVDFEMEVSVLVARNEMGSVKSFPVVRNVHKNHILFETYAPAEIEDSLAEEARQIAFKMAEALDLVGLLAVEMFVLREPNERRQNILMNEIAPRPHNSGHWTMDACSCSQYEQLVRAICGLPLGDTRPLCAAVMRNLLGDEIEQYPELLQDPSANLHLYGKKESRQGRKMGHVTFLRK